MRQAIRRGRDGIRQASPTPQDILFPPGRGEPLQAIAAGIRAEVIRVLSAIGNEHRGHPGASLSIVDIVTALYFHLMEVDPADPAWAARDRLVLSKGHGCLAVYVALAERGFFDRAHLDTFRSVDSILQGHPDMRRTPGVDFTSGSLGNGLSGAVGMALAAREVRTRAVSVFVIAGDGEMQEGVVWEGAMAAAKYRLDNLVMFVDCNGLQGSGRVEDIMPLGHLGEKWRAFGWDVMEIDGHDMAAIVRASEMSRRKRNGRPSAILARTVKGKGVPYMEGDNSWHQRWPESRAASGSQDPPDCLTDRSQRSAGLRRCEPNPSTKRAIARLISTRDAYAEALLALGGEREDIVAVCADTLVSMGAEPFARAYPDRCFEVGIAEQNLMMVAAGLAATGKTVFAHTYGTFATMRACEQLRTFVAGPGLDVKIVAGLGGLSGGIEGTTHLALEDLGMLRCIPGLVILNPADAVETRQAVCAAAARRGSVYIRLGRDPSPALFDGRHPFAIGKGVTLIERGWDAAIVTTGLITATVLEAAELLARAGVSCTVIECATVKPLDRELVSQAASRAGMLFTVEDHNIVGGLGSAVAEIVSEDGGVPLCRIGIDDRFLESGTPDELRRKYGLTADAIAARVRRRLGEGRR